MKPIYLGQSQKIWFLTKIRISNQIKPKFLRTMMTTSKPRGQKAGCQMSRGLNIVCLFFSFSPFPILSLLLEELCYMASRISGTLTACEFTLSFSLTSCLRFKSRWWSPSTQPYYWALNVMFVLDILVGSKTVPTWRMITSSKSGFL